MENTNEAPKTSDGKEVKQPDQAELRQPQSVKKEIKEEKIIGRKGRIPTAQNWNRIRSNSLGDIRELISRKRDREKSGDSPENREKILKKTTNMSTGKTAEEEELMLEEGDDKLTNRDLMLKILSKMNKREKEREAEKAEMKKEIKSQIQAAINEERKKWQKESKELEEKINKKLEDWRNEFKGKILEPEQGMAASEERKKEGETERKMKMIEKRCERLEAEERKKCVIIKGLKKERKGLEREMEKFFAEKLEVEVKVQESNRIGYERNIVWVKLSTQEEKEQIMANKRKLGNEKIFIEQERTREEREVQRAIVQYARKLKEKGKDVKIKFKRIEVDGKWYRWNEREGKLKEEINFRPGAKISIENMEVV